MSGKCSRLVAGWWPSALIRRRWAIFPTWLGRDIPAAMTGPLSAESHRKMCVRVLAVAEQPITGLTPRHGTEHAGKQGGGACTHVVFPPRYFHHSAEMRVRATPTPNFTPLSRTGCADEPKQALAPSVATSSLSMCVCACACVEIAHGPSLAQDSQSLGHHLQASEPRLF